MRVMNVFRGLLVLMAAAPALPAVPAPPKVDPKADAVLTALGKAYGEAKTFAADLDRVFTMEGSRGSARGEFQYVVLMQRPNKVAATLRKGDGMTVLSDGRNLYKHVPSLKQFSVAPAPQALGRVLTGPEFHEEDMFHWVWSIVDALSAPDPRAALLEGATRVQLVAEAADASGHHQVRITRGRWSVDYWIGGGDKPVLLKMRPDFSVLGNDPRLQLNAVFRNWRLNSALNNSQFAFVAGPGDSRVEELGGPPAHPLKGKTAPALALPMLDGTSFNLAQQKGKNIVVLEFWATWCGPCRMTLPVMQNLVNAYKGKAVKFVAVNLGDGPGQVRGFLNRQGFSGIPCALDEDAASGATWGADSIPMTVIVDKNGKIAEVHQGFWEGYEGSLREDLDRMLSGE